MSQAFRQLFDGFGLVSHGMVVALKMEFAHLTIVSGSEQIGLVGEPDGLNSHLKTRQDSGV
jgi:hypothetical protein